MRIFMELWRQKNFMFKLGVVICVTWILVAILAPVISPYSPTEVVMEDRFQSPNARHWFGPTIWAGMSSAGCFTAAGCPSPAA